MSQLRAPEHVLFDLKACFRDEKYARSYRIGVVTGLETEDDILRVSGGIADFGMHEELARRLDPGNDGHVQLPVKCILSGLLSVVVMTPGWAIRRYLLWLVKFQMSIGIIQK